MKLYRVTLTREYEVEAISRGDAVRRAHEAEHIEEAMPTVEVEPLSEAHVYEYHSEAARGRNDSERT